MMMMMLHRSVATRSLHYGPKLSSVQTTTKTFPSNVTPTTTTILCRSKATSSTSRSSRSSHSAESLLESASDYFGALRWRAANALTASLSPEERHRLLERLDTTDGQEKRTTTTTTTTTPNSSSSLPPNGTTTTRDSVSAAPIPSQNLSKQEEDTSELQNNNNNHVPTQTISEAVARARTQEAQLQKDKWEREKETLLKEAEKAAFDRVESSLAIQKRRLAFEQWKQNLEKDQARTTTTMTTTPQPPTTQPTVTPSSVDQEQQLQTKEKEKVEENIHPILGRVVADLGHKRIHLVSAQALSAIPVWRKQRIYRHGRAKSMATDKLKSLHLGLPGIIGIYEDPDGNLSILDGQHRVGMMKVLQEKKLKTEGEASSLTMTNDSFDFDRILVEVYRQPQQVATGTSDNNADESSSQKKNDTYAQEIFLEVNKAEPVKLVDLPGVAKSTHRKIINDGAARLQERFPKLFSDSQRCRPPHLNIDNLRDALFASNVLDRHSLKSAKALETWMMGQNDGLATKFAASDDRRPPGVSASAWNKAVEHDFYLGLDSSWYYN